MTTTQVVLLIVGIIFIIVSFFIVEKNKRTGTDILLAQTITELTLKEEEAIKLQIHSILDKEIELSINEAKDRLNHISNESIMSIDEYSNQVLAKIEHSNDEVVFLYNMLTKKEEEFKAIWSNMEQARRENKELLDKLAKLKIAREKSLESRAKTASSPKEATKTVPYSSDSKEVDNHTLHSQMDVIVSEEGFDKNEEILKLYKQNKSVMDISKELGLGQGEVKLVIDLYGQK